jgi:hypothetical protein
LAPDDFYSQDLNNAIINHSSEVDPTLLPTNYFDLHPI